MTVLGIDINSDISRIRAALVNSGKHSFSEAEARLAKSRLTIAIGAVEARTAAGQVAFLTATVTATRCFGRVAVEGNLSERLILPIPIAAGSLAEAAHYFGATTEPATRSVPRVLIGSGLEPGERSIQANWNGWSVGLARDGARAGRGRWRRLWHHQRPRRLVEV
jgi:hypothetical protein